MKTSKAAKEIRATLAQMDEALALSELAAKQRAEILAEKSKLLVTLLTYDREASDEETAETIAKMTATIAELNERLAEGATRIGDLEKQNAVLEKKANERLIEYQPDPEAAKLRERLAGLEPAIRMVSESLTFEKKVTAAYQLSQQCSQEIVDIFARLAGIDAEQLTRCLALNQVELIRWRGAADLELKAMVRTIEGLKFPPAPPPQLTKGFVSDTRSAEEKLQEAKERTRLAWR